MTAWHAVSFAATHLINVAENSLLDAVMLDNLAEHASVTAADNQDVLRVGMGVHGEVGDHLLVPIPY
jgi:hypothetical protein